MNNENYLPIIEDSKLYYRARLQYLKRLRYDLQKQIEIKQFITENSGTLTVMSKNYNLQKTKDNYFKNEQEIKFCKQELQKYYLI